MEFLDTNVLVYAASGIPADREKAHVARALATRSELGISLQVLQEFYNAARQPRKLDFTHEEALAYCHRWRKFTIFEPTLRLFDDALEVCNRFQINYYDAAIVAAARALGCSLVYSEDLGDGQRYGTVRVENPFRGL